MASSNTPIINNSKREQRPSTNTSTLESGVYSIQYVYTNPTQLLKYTDVLCFRVPLLYKVLYKEKIKSDPVKYRMFKESLLSIIKEIAEANLSIIDNKIEINLQPQININIENKAEARADANMNIDVAGIVDRLDQIISYLNRLIVVAPGYRPVAKKLLSDLKELRRMVVRN